MSILRTLSISCPRIYLFCTIFLLILGGCQNKSINQIDNIKARIISLHNQSAAIEDSTWRSFANLVLVMELSNPTSKTIHLGRNNFLVHQSKDGFRLYSFMFSRGEIAPFDSDTTDCDIQFSGDFGNTDYMEFGKDSFYIILNYVNDDQNVLHSTGLQGIDTIFNFNTPPTSVHQFLSGDVDQ